MGRPPDHSPPLVALNTLAHRQEVTERDLRPELRRPSAAKGKGCQLGAGATAHAQRPQPHTGPGRHSVDRMNILAGMRCMASENAQPGVRGPGRHRYPARAGCPDWRCRLWKSTATRTSRNTTGPAWTCQPGPSTRSVKVGGVIRFPARNTNRKTRKRQDQASRANKGRPERQEPTDGKSDRSSSTITGKEAAQQGPQATVCRGGLRPVLVRAGQGWRQSSKSRGPIGLCVVKRQGDRGAPLAGVDYAPGGEPKLPTITNRLRHNQGGLPRAEVAGFAVMAWGACHWRINLDRGSLEGPAIRTGSSPAAGGAAELRRKPHRRGGCHAGLRDSKCGAVSKPDAKNTARRPAQASKPTCSQGSQGKGRELRAPAVVVWCQVGSMGSVLAQFLLVCCRTRALYSCFLAAELESCLLPGVLTFGERRASSIGHQAGRWSPASVRAQVGLILGRMRAGAHRGGFDPAVGG